MEPINKDNVKSYTQEKSLRSINASRSTMVFRVMGIILLCLIIISFIRKAYSGTPITFSSFLNWLGNLNTFQLNVSINSFQIGGNWGLVDGLRQFFNAFGLIIGVNIWLFANLFNCLIFISQFLYFIFV